MTRDVPSATRAADSAYSATERGTHLALANRLCYHARAFRRLRSATTGSLRLEQSMTVARKSTAKKATPKSADAGKVAPKRVAAKKAVAPVVTARRPVAAPAAKPPLVHPATWPPMVTSRRRTVEK